MKVAPFTGEMNPARRQTVLFLLCAVVLLGAGFGCGYVYCYNGFYSPESQLDRELTDMNFNSRVLYYANVGRRLECRRELVKQLREQVAYVDKLVASAPETDSSASARTSIKQARNVLSGQPINAGPP